MKTKLVTVRFPAELHKALVDYCELRYLPVSSVILRLVAEELKFKPRQATARTTELPVAPQYWDGSEYVSTPKEEPEEVYEEFTEEEMLDLQRRAAAAPVRPME